MDPRLDVFTLPTVVVVAADVPATLYMSAYNGLNKLEPVTTMAYRLPLEAGTPDLVWQVNISLPESWNVTDTGVGVNVPPTVVTSADLVVQPMHYTGDGDTGSGNYLGAFVALHADTGDVVWTAQAPSGIEVPVALTPQHCPSPTTCVEQQLLFAGDRGGTVTTPYLASLNITTGKQLWMNQLTDLTASRAAAYIDPTVPGGRVLVAQGTDDGFVIAVDIATQDLVWKEVIGAGYCSPSIAQLEAGAAPVLYCLDTQYTMHVVNASSGVILQSKDVGPAAGCSVDEHVCVASDGVALSDDQEVHIALGPVLMTLSGIKPSPTPSPAASPAASPASTQGPTPAASPATTQTPPASPTPAASASSSPAASFTSVPTGFPSPSPSAGAGSAAHHPSKPSKPSPAGGIAAGVIITLIVLSIVGYLVYWRRGPGKYKSWWALCECRSTKPGSQFKSLSAQGSFATSSGKASSSATASSSAGASRATYSQI